MCNSRHSIVDAVHTILLTQHYIFDYHYFYPMWDGKMSISFWAE